MEHMGIIRRQERNIPKVFFIRIAKEERYQNSPKEKKIIITHSTLSERIGASFISVFVESE